MSAETRRIRKLPKVDRSLPAHMRPLPEAAPPTLEASPRKHLTYALTKPRSVEGYVTLAQLAAECGIQAQLARLWAKRAGLKKPNDGWRWEVGSSKLKRVRKALGLSS